MSAAQTFLLPAVLDLNAATTLRNDMQAHLGSPLDLDASQVERVGGLCAQVLIAATHAWRVTGHPLRVINSSTAFADDLRLLGVSSLIVPKDGGASC